jgi:hypothetical protein
MALDPGTKLAAECEIRNLVARLAHLADDGNLEEYLQLFTEDGSWSHAGETPLVGRAAIREGAERRISESVQGPGSGTRHLNTTLYVEVEGATDARAVSYYLYLGTHGGVAPLKTGRYLDQFRRTEAGWKLASRVLVDDVN